MLSAHTTVLSLFKQRGNNSFSNGNWTPDAIVSLCPFYHFGSQTFAVTHPGRALLPNNAVIVYWYLTHSMNMIYFGIPFVFQAGTNLIFKKILIFLYIFFIKYISTTMRNLSLEISTFFNIYTLNLTAKKSNMLYNK